MDTYIRRQFDNNFLSLESNIQELNGIGPYIYGRIKQGLKIPGTVTVKKFISKFKNKTGTYISHKIQTLVQNQRSNQCVNSYHTRDVNKRGYDVSVALLRYAKDKKFIRGLVFDRIPNTNESTEDAKVCGCLSYNQCRGSPDCEYINRNCVPSSQTAIGFEGVGERPGQTVRFSDKSESRRVLKKTRVRRSGSFYLDPDSVADDLLGYVDPQYTRKNNNLWRKPGGIVRVPR